MFEGRFCRSLSQVERLKAVLGGSSSVLNAIELTTEQERGMTEDYEDEDLLLANLLGASLGKKGSRLELQLEGAKEREAAVEAEEKEARELMITIRDEVSFLFHTHTHGSYLSLSL